MAEEPAATTLGAHGLDDLPAAVARPSYDPDDVGCGIVHIGVGNFHRAHQAMFVDRLLDAGEREWGICGVGLLPHDAAMRDALSAQDGLYTLVTAATDGTESARVIGSLTRYLYAPDDPDAVLSALCDPRTRIVSLTITEGDTASTRPREPSRRRTPPPAPTSTTRRREGCRHLAARSATSWLLSSGVVRRVSRRSPSCHATTSRATATRRGPPSRASRIASIRLWAPGSAAPSPSRTRWSTGSPRDDRRDTRHRGGAVRHRRPVARAFRGLRAVGARRRLPARSSAVRDRRGAARRRRRTVRADEAAAAQRVAPGDELSRDPRGRHDGARGVLRPPLRPIPARLHAPRGDPHAPPGTGHRSRRLLRAAPPALRQHRGARHPGPSGRRRSRPHPDVPAPCGARTAGGGRAHRARHARARGLERLPRARGGRRDAGARDRSTFRGTPRRDRGRGRDAGAFLDHSPCSAPSERTTGSAARSSRRGRPHRGRARASIAAVG
ncbi:hypothetical protein G4G29_04125 [Microbacterium sp. Se63.02b]|nr:hypothetical protein G4G29_04125 [Microbacterium sp. Se63.02b]